MWLEDEKKYARRSLKTKKETEAKELAKSLYLKIYSKIQQGDKFFSVSAKEGVDAYLKERYNDFVTGLIVKKRYKSLEQNLKHFLNFIGKNKKLKELSTNDLVNYYKYRLEITNNNVKTSTVASEQITINAMVKWLYKKKEIDIVQFEFKRLPNPFG